MKTSPAFQFYPTAWLGSQRVAMLSLEEEGAYIRLLAYCWQHGSIPSDPEKASKLIGKGASTTLATTVLTMFTPSSDSGRMVHDRLDEEREKQRLWSEKSSLGGKKSAEMRSKFKGGTKGGSTVVEKCYQPNGNSLSLSLSLNKDAQPKPTKKTGEPNPDHSKFIERWMCEFETQFGHAYFFNGGKDAKAVSLLLKTEKSIEDLFVIVKNAWSIDSFHCKKARTIHGYQDSFNQIAIEVNEKSSQPALFGGKSNDQIMREALS